MSVLRRIAAMAVVVLGGGIAGLVAVSAGPDKLVVCTTARGLDGFAARLSQSHIDGAAATYCTVPSESSWIAGGVVFTVLLTGATLVYFFRFRQRAV
jgi:hypothetical protein